MLRNLKVSFELCIHVENQTRRTCLRVFDPVSLHAVHYALKCKVFGHVGKSTAIFYPIVGNVLFNKKSFSINELYDVIETCEMIGDDSPRLLEYLNSVGCELP